MIIFIYLFKSSEIETSLLVIILDVNPVQRIVKQETKILSQCLESTIVFANSHFMQSSNNELAFMVCHGHSAKFLYPCENMAEIRQIDGQYEKFTMVERTVKQQLQQVINEISMDASLNTESLISGALSMALCYIARLEREKVASQKLYPRMLVITGSNDSAMQYMNYMNIFFTAQRMVLSLY